MSAFNKCKYCLTKGSISDTNFDPHGWFHANTKYTYACFERRACHHCEELSFYCNACNKYYKDWKAITQHLKQGSHTESRKEWDKLNISLSPAAGVGQQVATNDDDNDGVTFMKWPTELSCPRTTRLIR